MPDLNSQIPGLRGDTDERTAALEEALAERLLVLDGATGTAMQAIELTAEDFGGPELEGCNENLCATRPDVVDQVHEFYLAAGADIVETNSFGGTPLVLAEYGLEDQAFELNRLSAEIARAACARHDAPGRPRFVCGSMGPTTKAISVTGGVTFEELIEHFRAQAAGLMAGGADYLLLETCQDTRNIKAGLFGIERAFESAGWRIPDRRLGDHRADGHHARRAGRRGPGGLADACRPAVPRPQLCHRAGADERPSEDALRVEPHPGGLRAQCRPAR